MKKQFNKVKQFADNARSRADKLDADVISEDLLDDERRVECIRAMCATTRRRITNLLTTTAAGRKPPSSSSAASSSAASSSSVSDRPPSGLFSATTIINAATNPSSAMAAAGAGSLSFDEHNKLMKKSPDHQLGVCFKASSEVLGVDSVIGRILVSCAQLQMRLADQRLSLEQLVDSQVIQNSVMQQLLQHEIPDVNKQRKTLTRLAHEVDSLRNKLASSSSGSAGSGNQHQMHRMDSVRSDLAVAEQKLQECKDRWVGDMYHVLSRETELSQLFVQLMRLQLHYHRSSLELLELSVPQLEEFVESANTKPVYGLSLEEHLRVSGRRIALPLQLCVCRLLQLGVDQEGLFRIAGSTTRVRKLKQCLNASRQLAPQLLDECCSDVHVLADAIKSYLRSLPDPLMCLAMYDQWLSVAAIKDTGQKLQLVKQLLHQLPPAHCDNLCYLIKFLAHLCKDQTVTRMSPSNLAIVMAPNLLWLDETAAAAAGSQFDMRTLTVLTWLVEMFIVHCDTLFTQDVSFFDGYDDIVGAGCAVTADSLNAGSRLSLISGVNNSRHSLRSPSAAAAAPAQFDMSDTSCHSAASSAGGGAASSSVSSPPATPMISLSRSERYCSDRRSMLGSTESLLSTDSQQQQQQYSAVGSDSPYNASIIRRARRKKNFAPTPPTEPVVTCSAPSLCALPPSAAPSSSSKPVSPPARAPSFRRPLRPSVPPPPPILKTIHPQQQQQQQTAAAAAAFPLLPPPPPPPPSAAAAARYSTAAAAAAAAVPKTAAEKIVQSRDWHNETTLSDQPDRVPSLVTGGVTATTTATAPTTTVSATNATTTVSATTATTTATAAFPVVYTDSANAETAGAELASASCSTISISAAGGATTTAAAGSAAGAGAVSHLPVRPVVPPRPASSIRDSAALPASPPVLRTSAFDRSKPPAVRLLAQISDQTAATAAPLHDDWVTFAE